MYNPGIRNYTDFKQNIIGKWILKNKAVYDIKTDFELSQKQDVVIGISLRGDEQNKLIDNSYYLDNHSYACTWARSETSYMDEAGVLKAFRHSLSRGKHSLTLKCQKAGDYCEIIFYLYKFADNTRPSKQAQIDKILAYPSAKSLPDNQPEFDLTDYTLGVGGDDLRCIGRFGFTKGDGLLDCAMTTLGCVNRLHLFGHPDYKKNTRWQYSFLPRDIDPETKYHGSFPPAQVGIENDNIDIKYLSVKWHTKFKKISGKEINYTCLYSLASAGIMLETDDDKLDISDLLAAGNYRKALLPLKSGLIVRDIFSMQELYNRHQDGELKENWILIYGADNFPDIPIQIVMQKKPKTIKQEYYSGQLTSIQIRGNDNLGRAFMVSPFGFEMFAPEVNMNDDFINDAYQRCNFWSRAVLAFPIDAKEYYKIDDDNQQIKIVQKFEYEITKDEWRTEALKLAPVPPISAMLDDTDIIKFDSIIDYKFPTKFGYLKGACNTDYSSYTTPLMPTERIFPLKNSQNNDISEKFNVDIEDYFDYHDKFDKSEQATPFSGACAEPYAWTSGLGVYMSAENREKIGEKALERLKMACNPDTEYKYPIVEWHSFMAECPDTERVIEIYNAPDLAKINLHNWYKRKEPLTNIEYRIAYLNVCMFYNGAIKTGTKQEIFDYKNPLVENDWGVGISFYSMYLSALAAGDFTPIKENWDVLCEAFKYFEIYHDWACMGSAYSECGSSWVEGAAYGAFIAFANMAEAVGDQKTYNKVLYLNAKYMALRLATLKSSYTYYFKFFNHEAWYATKFIPDEVAPDSKFIGVPILVGDNYSPGSVFNFTTEGFFIETFMMFNKFLPEDLKLVRDRAMYAYANSNEDIDVVTWSKEQENASCLLAAAINEKTDKESVLREIEEVDKRGLLFKKWRAMHSFSRLLPRNYLRCLLLGLLENRDHPAWLEFWNNAILLNTEYNPDTNEVNISFKKRSGDVLIRLGIRKNPDKVLLNGKEIDCKIKHSKLTIKPKMSGELKLVFYS